MDGQRMLPVVEPAGRLLYHVRIRFDFGEGTLSSVTEPPAHVIGLRWAQWKARRMLRAELRRG